MHTTRLSLCQGNVTKVIEGVTTDRLIKGGRRVSEDVGADSNGQLSDPSLYVILSNGRPVTIGRQPKNFLLQLVLVSRLMVQEGTGSELEPLIPSLSDPPPTRTMC